MPGVRIIAAFALGAAMSSTLVAQTGPEQVFQQGPEDLIAASAAIVTGPVSGYSRRVLKQSEPGPDAFPLEWVATAEIREPVSLKGKAPRGPIHFSRTERSPLAPLDRTAPIWERAYGELSPVGTAVVFLAADDSPRVMAVLPSGDGEQDLVALVRDVIRIQSLVDPVQKQQAWLRYLGTAVSDAGHRVALRSLVAGGADWSDIAPALTSLFKQQPIDENARGFAFDFVAFHIVKGTWGTASERAAGFLCDVISGERETDLVLRYLQAFKQVLAYTIEEPRQPSRELLHKRVFQCVERLASRGTQNPEVEEELSTIRHTYAWP